MKKTDGRKFNTETQQQIRYIAIKLRKSGKTYVEIARVLDIHYTAVIKWWRCEGVEMLDNENKTKYIDSMLSYVASVKGFSKEEVLLKLQGKLK